ncbi:hypothetical protein BST61_g9740 [Cercospora zeina]
MAGQLACRECPRRFASTNELENHKITHLTPSVRCLCCPRLFTTFPGMMIHIESGTCDSGMNLPSVNRMAAQCFQWKKYLSKEYREDILARDTGYRKAAAQPFKCPSVWAGEERRGDWEVEAVDGEGDI